MLGILKVALATLLTAAPAPAPTSSPTATTTSAPGTDNGSAPAPGTGTTTQPTVKLATYNILRNGSRGPQGIIDTLKPLDADVICMQESYNPLNAPYLGSRLGMTTWSTSPGGQAILSRLPTRFLGVVPGFEHDTGVDALWADLTLPDATTVRLICVHLHTVTPKTLAGLLQTEPLRGQQIAKLRQAWATAGHPTLIIAGDFNELPGTPNYRAMTQSFTDTLAALTPPQTAPTFEQGFRIDYILTTPNLTPLAGGVVNSKASDHYPIWTTLTASTQPATRP